MNETTSNTLPLWGKLRAFPSPRGNFLWSQKLRETLLNENFDYFILELPELCKDYLFSLVEQLPKLSILTLESENGYAYIPTDPCDSMIEVIRSNINNPERVYFCSPDHLPLDLASPWVQDPNYIEHLSIAEYQGLLTPILNEEQLPNEYTQSKSQSLETIKGIINPDKKGLWIGSCRDYFFYNTHIQNNIQSSSPHPPEAIQLNHHSIKAEQSYFALGELPFYTAQVEHNRSKPLEPIPSLTQLIKQLWIQTRWDHLEGEDQIRRVPTTKIQRALIYLRNLAWIEGRTAPGLMDIVEAAQGVFGDTFASKVLEAARYYPYFDPFDEEFTELRPDSIKAPLTREFKPIRNLFRDSNLQWRPINLRPEVTPDKMKEYRYSWDPSEMCSHLPEDVKIEQFNQHLRSAALRQLNEDHSKSEPFSSSLKDGLDIRETLRNWHTCKIYVKETPPKLGNMDTVVILFDSHNDDKYPHQTVWFAEHPEESTLTFFSTDPFAKMIGPGIAEANYGGLSLLFPPQPTPDPFRDPTLLSQCDSLSEVLVANALRFSKEKNICIASPTAPNLRMKKWAQKYGKKIIHLPFSKFSLETLEKLRKFHILNGKDIRSYAKRFIGE